MPHAFITELGTILRVNEPWFYRARHAFALAEAFGIKTDRNKPEKTVVVFPTDTTFKVVRFYVKRNQKSASSIGLRVEQSPISNLEHIQFDVSLADFNAARLAIAEDAAVGGDNQEHRGAIIDGDGLKKLRKKRMWNRLWVEATYDDPVIGHVAGPIEVQLGSTSADSMWVRINEMSDLGVPYLASRFNGALAVKSEQTEFRHEPWKAAPSHCTVSFYHISREAPR